MASFGASADRQTPLDGCTPHAGASVALQGTETVPDRFAREAIRLDASTRHVAE